MGKHSDGASAGQHRAGQPGGGRALALVAVAVVVVVGATGGYALSRDSGGAGDEPHSDATMSVSESASNSASWSGSVDAEVSAEDRSACVGEVISEDAVVAAIAASAKSWREHTSAQVKLDKGEYTRDQTLAQWAKSKARGPEDLRKYKEAAKRAKTTAGACGSIPDGDVTAAGLDDCIKRLEALSAVKKPGKKIKDQWSAHQDMMTNKDKMTAEPGGGDHYAHMWSKMVKDAGPTLTKYDTAVDALAKAPACS